MSNDRVVIGIALALVSTLIAVDIINDLVSGGTWGHLAIEVIVLLISSSGAVYLWQQFLLVREENRQLQTSLAQTESDLASWKNDAEKHLEGLGAAIDRQMEKWVFTPAEKEIGLLLLKGFSFKEIGAIRQTSERTTRQQSLEIYRKSGLSGRAEFAGFFLEDLLLPGSVEN